ncbi:sugar transferase [Sandarakinorhabdus sp. DWP1-3-1]|uniref:sugar transferase n=1 Tax=Sandarakinorhabdus sp. DWP1-3-1 TaxID=2804627 RepID=UPI003CECAB3C
MVARLLQAALALAALLVTAPIIAAAALAVAIGLGMPVLFTQVRSGQSGVPFAMIKLRSMSDARDAGGQLLPDSERLTGLGRFLRRSRIDELPGLWHVVTGEMALVGPRPLLPQTITAMGRSGERRGLVRPGLTGWAQVNGNALLSDGDKLALDLWYIDHASAWLDARIIVETVRVVLFGERINHVRIGRGHASRHRRRG